jgi:hypothetical protein
MHGVGAGEVGHVLTHTGRLACKETPATENETRSQSTLHEEAACYKLQSLAHCAARFHGNDNINYRTFFMPVRCLNAFTPAKRLLNG